VSSSNHYLRQLNIKQTLFSIFDTDHFDWTINNASSYLDLSILYGASEAQLDTVRRNDGTTLSS